MIDQHLRAAPEECYFWATHSGAELDLLWVRGRHRWGSRSSGQRPRADSLDALTLEDLRLSRLFVVHAGVHTFPLAPRIRAVAFDRLLEDLAPLA